MNKQKYVILLVDDDADFLEATQLLLEAHGFEVMTAGGQKEGMEVISQAKLDAIIVDLMMEDVDGGAKMARSLKESGNTVPVFMLSSVGDELNRYMDYNELGLQGVFQKPVNVQELVHALESRIPKGN